MDEPKELRKGQFGHPETVHRQGRRPGQKNRITALKLILEEAAIERNQTKIQKVLDGIIEDAIDGDSQCRKLVWSALMSTGTPDVVKGTDKVEIKIGRFDEDPPKDIEADVTIIEEEEDEEHQTDK